MKCICKATAEFFRKDWSNAEKILVMLVCLLAGMLHGFSVAPIKKGINFGNHSGNTYVKEEKEEE